MATLLYIEASPRKQRSSSIAIAREFLDGYKKSHPKDKVISIDLWKKNLPPFDGNVIDSKYAIMQGKQFTDEQKMAWEDVEKVIAEFKSADKYVISLPMWNFSIPYVLKHYFDVITQPGYTFSFSPKEGYKGLVTGKKMLLICSRGGAYGSGTGAEAFDHQIHYMETILKFIGFQNIQLIVIEPTLQSNEAKESTLQRAREQAQIEAGHF